MNLSPDQAGPSNLLSPLSTKLRSGCSRCASTRSLLKQMSISKRVIKQRLQILLHRNEQYRKLNQSLFRKVRIERKLKKDRIKKDALIQKLMQENSLLANIPPTIAAQTLSAPAHNMFAEQTLGLADHLMRKAPNITIGFVDGKVKSKINKTLNWLSNKTEDEQGNFV